MRSNIISLACLWLLAAPMAAQQNDHVALKIDVVAWGNEIKGLSFKPGSGKAAITALSFRYSTPVTYSGPVVMEVYQSDNVTAAPVGPAVKYPAAGRLIPQNPFGTGEAADSSTNASPKQGLALELERRRKKEPTLVALAVLPGGDCRHATVLLAPAEAGTFTSYVIDDDPSKLPVGQLRIHNLSPFLVAMRCNGEPARQLKTRDAILVPAVRDHLIYELAYKLDDVWNVQENNVIPVRPNEQTQIIILKSDHSFFLASDGSRSGFLQFITLRRSPDAH